MRRFIIAPDSFKGTMRANEVIEIIANAILKYNPDAIIHGIPLSDGGEGMVDCFSQIQPLTFVSAMARDLFLAPIQVDYGLLSPTQAVMEMSSCAGLPLAKGRENPLWASTCGIGDLILHAAQHGVTHIVMGIGGSATNDCGIGMAYALGYRFYDSNGAEVAPSAAWMHTIAHIEKPPTLPDVHISVACDVDNPLYGPNGAAHIFGPQKGADRQMVNYLDAGLRNMADILQRDLGVNVRELPGAGAAGGLGAGLAAFLGGTLRPGIDMLLDAAGMDELLAEADIVITGEGRIDGQSMRGKVPIGVARRAQQYHVPCIALCGSIGDAAEDVYACGIHAIFSSIRGFTDMCGVEISCKEDMCLLAEAVIRTLLLTK